MSSDEFLTSQGELSLAPFGPISTNFAIHGIISHPGGVKYDPVIARHRLSLCYLITAKFEIVTRVVKTSLASSGLNRDDIDLHSQHLRSCIDQANKICQDSGLQQAIDMVKMLSYQPRKDSNPFLPAKPRGPAREQQLHVLVEQAQDLARQGLDPDPDKICPFGMDLTSSVFRAKFLGLEDGHDLRSMGKSMGRDEKSHDNWRRNIDLQGERKRQEKLERGVQPSAVDLGKRLTAALEHLSNPAHPNGLKWQMNKEIGLCWRYVQCNTCHKHLLSRNPDQKHCCPSGVDSEPLKVNGNTFPQVQRLLYVHDILGDPSLFSIVPQKALQDLVSRPAKDVLLSNKSKLPPADYESVTSLIWF
ncbi:hypothetical protein JAAARDRAFT_196012 [Jaapia argillacea MUCL 33604]|uniref:Uncharacterized protein n=1 Tax=Jaapia argillacea MUCL 33604 TaxID=933084 RepID=A0A067PK14_9AGAM|nr:hypothetical protein JAAARDRAFT_196012 [Jaapia argillacea MUCL 33604]